jgi:conjugative transposon TraN protein
MCWLFTCATAQSKSLLITTDKTTSLVFPFPVLHVDRGTKDFYVQQVKEANNILLVKAASRDFTETNLSVITRDGMIYSFKINYSNDPEQWIYHLPPTKKASLVNYANGLLDNPETMKGVYDRQWDMETHLAGIYIKDEAIFYQLQLKNKSPIDYDIDLLRFYIRDKKKGKRTATQEIEMHPLHISGNTTTVKANSISHIVVALEKFTVPDAKYLAVEIMEKKGGRHLLMKVNNKRIIRAIPLPDFK